MNTDRAELPFTALVTPCLYYTQTPNPVGIAAILVRFPTRRDVRESDAPHSQHDGTQTPPVTAHREPTRHTVSTTVRNTTSDSTGAGTAGGERPCDATKGRRRRGRPAVSR